MLNRLIPAPVHPVSFPRRRKSRFTVHCMIFLLYILHCIFVPTPCFAATITVDDDNPAADHDKIQNAINIAADYDTIVVSPGHYYENIDFRGKPITLTSTAPTDPNTVADTIIDANNDGIVVSFHTNEGPNSIITGFTITRGHAKYGAGICCWNDCSPTIIYCSVLGNVATDDGGGIYCDEGLPTITHCTVANNSASDQGGGLFCDNSSYPSILHSLINANTANYGGGISCWFTRPNLSVTACAITDNHANHRGGGILCNRSSPSLDRVAVSGNWAARGGGIDCASCAPTITNCIIIDNFSNTDGGGICCLDGSPTIKHCTVGQNAAEDDGGGIYCGDDCLSIIAHNIIFGNISGRGLYAIYSNPVISYNNVWGNADGDYGGWAWPGVGDISVDPCFIDPGHWEAPCNTPADPTDDLWIDGDYHLHYNSLCINAGDPNYVPDPCEVDFEGDPRIRLGRIDIGADEADSNPADFDENGFVDLIDYSTLTAAWQTDPNNPAWNPLCDLAPPTNSNRHRRSHHRHRPMALASTLVLTSP